MYFTKIKETGLYVQDLDRTQNFYERKLGLEVIGRSEGRHIFFKSGTTVLLCFIAGATKFDEQLPRHYAAGKMHIAFEVPKDQYEEIKEKIRAQNISIEHEQQWGDEYRSFYFRDPDGHSLEVVPEGMWD